MTIFSPFTVTITDSAASPASVDVQLYVTALAAGPTLVPVTTGTCTAELSCTVQIATVTGGTPPYYFTSDTFANGAPPLGMIIDLDGYLTGTAPGSEGTHSFSVCVVDAMGAQDCDTTSITVEVPGIEKFDGSYTGSYSGTAVGTQIGDFPISGGTSVTISNGIVSGTTDDGAVAGTINLNGAITMGIVGVSDCPVQYTGTIVISTEGVASGSGTWSCPVTGGGSATGTWSVTRP
jgi:hypothetical protein